ncbi:glutamate receptor 2.1-like [Magnolia sinica]|uniref:glutamate receptor 2.1-like n=1 Tax=Magnolia sinica TaxID=86752 RepID=UPI002658766D|nr:glutamate receptor 2.1-like [Magnolia sinica]
MRLAVYVMLWIRLVISQAISVVSKYLSKQYWVAVKWMTAPNAQTPVGIRGAEAPTHVNALQSPDNTDGNAAPEDKISDVHLFSKWGFSQKNGVGLAEFKAGVVLDFETLVGKMGLSCIRMGLEDFYAAHTDYTTRLSLHIRDSKNDVVVAASAALDLLKNVEVQAIIGPQKSAAADFVAKVGVKTQVPIISFSATSPSLSSSRAPYFIRTAQNDSSQVKAITAIVQAFAWREVVLIYEDTDYGTGVIPYLTDAFQDINTQVPFRSVIPLQATDDQILRELYKLMTRQTRVFVVHISSSLAVRFFPKVKEAGMMSTDYVWIITDGLTDLLDLMGSSVIDSMQGVLGLKPYVAKSKDLDDFTVRWKRKFRQENPDAERVEPSIFGLWAYDTVWALAMAAERVGTANSHFQKPKTIENSTELETLGVSQVGPKLLDAILKTEFHGLSSEFRLINGELQPLAFQIVNVMGKGAREIGFWTPTYGISRNLNLNTDPEKTYSASKDDLAPVFWPGESTSVPKGWMIPTGEKKMRIGVPVKYGFREFVKVEQDSRTNASIVTGFSIDVFKAVIETLPYAVPYELIPFKGPDEHMAGSYNDLVYQVHLQKYDAVAGDITITANRSSYVDFTLPYTESGVSMVAPMREDRKNAWIFLKPLTRDLWLVSWAFFIFTGFVVWVLEHSINSEFRGPASEQLGMTMWFSFSTLVFANKERVVSNLSRFVLIIWFFVVLVLTSSYTASLTSMLTVERLQPTVTDVAELIKNGDYVGYQRTSFVFGLLKEMKFDESKLRAYGTPEEFDEALINGSKNGGVSAIFHEVPYIKLFLSKYCGKYSMVGPIHPTAGFGFVFPKGSPLVPDVSRAILNVTQGDRMVTIQKAWFGDQTTCVNQGPTVTSQRLALDSFSGLFLITGFASISALTIFLAFFLFKNRGIFTNAQYDSIWERFIAIVKRFDQMDDSADRSRMIESIITLLDLGLFTTCCCRMMAPNGQTLVRIEGVEAPTHVNAAQSPMSIPYDTDGNNAPEDEISYVHSDASPSGEGTIQLRNMNPNTALSTQIVDENQR